MKLGLATEPIEKLIGNVPAFRSSGKIEKIQGTISASVRAAIGELCQVRNREGKATLAEVIGFDGQLTQIMPFEINDRLQRGDEVVALGRNLTVPVGVEVLGRVISATGKPLDGKSELRNSLQIAVDNGPPAVLTRSEISEPFVTGQRAIDGLLTIGLGQRVGLFAGSGVGKSTLLGQIAQHAHADVNVVAMVGERGREVSPFIQNALGTRGMKKSIVVVATANETPLARVKAADAAMAIADWHRSNGQHVLLMLDSLTRFAMAQRELGLMLGEPPTSRGYTPSVFQKLAVLLERMGTARCGSITGIITVLVEGDDMNDPIADSARSILDGHIVLSRKLANGGHFPAIDILNSNSRLFLELASTEQQRAATAVRQILARNDELVDLIEIGAYKKGTSAQSDLAIELLPKVNLFLQQELNQPESYNQTTQSLKNLSALWLEAKQ